MAGDVKVAWIINGHGQLVDVPADRLEDILGLVKGARLADGPGAPSEPSADGVPSGSAAEVLAWVGDDPARAAEAIEAEQAGKVRSSLLSKLAAITED